MEREEYKDWIFRLGGAITAKRTVERKQLLEGNVFSSRRQGSSHQQLMSSKIEALQQGDQQLDQDQRVGAPPVPDQLEEMPDHLPPPRKACTGCMRDMRQAGIAPDRTPNKQASPSA